MTFKFQKPHGKYEEQKTSTTTKKVVIADGENFKKDYENGRDDENIEDGDSYENVVDEWRLQSSLK